ncbi:MAG: hypothetical protein M5U28_12600 [Sandaracinaceae bacterium]|nr:hypothetical protein [Sandaracinaceae bacterium]
MEVIERLDAEMTLHDAAMTRFSQWWRRAERSGHAYAELAAMHGAPPERCYVRETRRIWAWGAAVPAPRARRRHPDDGPELRPLRRLRGERRARLPIGAPQGRSRADASRPTSFTTARQAARASQACSSST